MSTTHDTWTVAPEPFDSPDTVALWRECYTHLSDSWYLLKENRRTDPEELEREIAADPGTEFAPPRGALVVARRDGAAAGMAGVRLLDGERAELKRVFLRPEFRGTGAAARIIGAAEDRARRLGRPTWSWTPVPTSSRHERCTSGSATPRSSRTRSARTRSTGSARSSDQRLPSATGRRHAAPSASSNTSRKRSSSTTNRTSWGLASGCSASQPRQVMTAMRATSVTGQP